MKSVHLATLQTTYMVHLAAVCLQFFPSIQEPQRQRRPIRRRRPQRKRPYVADASEMNFGNNFANRRVSSVDEENPYRGQICLHFSAVCLQFFPVNLGTSTPKEANST